MLDYQRVCQNILSTKKNWWNQWFSIKQTPGQEGLADLFKALRQEGSTCLSFIWVSSRRRNSWAVAELWDIFSMRFLKPKPEAGREQLRKDSWWLIQPIEKQKGCVCFFLHREGWRYCPLSREKCCSLGDQIDMWPPGTLDITGDQQHRTPIRICWAARRFVCFFHRGTPKIHQANPVKIAMGSPISRQTLW